MLVFFFLFNVMHLHRQENIRRVLVRSLFDHIRLVDFVVVCRVDIHTGY